jgi:mannose-6-phosphate isomerase-like protein (cupin superfamily)
MENLKINIKEKFDKFNELWSPKIIAQMNNYHFKVAKIKGEFVWHKHDDTDEVFIVIEGTMNLEYKNKTVTVYPGEMIVVPKGIEHKPVAQNECKIMMIELAGTLNTGNSENELTKTKLDWV